MATSSSLSPSSSSSSSSSAVPKYLTLTDSHGTYTSTYTSMPTYTIHTKAVSGLKWLDNYRSDLSALNLLSTPPLSSQLSSVTAILFLIGTNSVRCHSTADIISHIQVIIDYIRTHQPHLSNKHSINI